MSFFKFITPSEIMLIKAMALGFYFGWMGKKLFKAKASSITNVKFDLKEKV